MAQWLKNEWVVTLTATLIGVFLALYLNELMSSFKTNQQKSLAIENVKSEIENNESKLNRNIEKHYMLLDLAKFLGEYIDDEENLVVSPSILKEFKTKHPTLVDIADSTYLSPNLYQYEGEINLDIALSHIEITNITWSTMRNSGISTSFDFECLMYLETMDKLTIEIIEKNEVLLEYFIGTVDSGDKNVNLINHINLLIDFEEGLIDIYQNSDEELDNCL